MISSGWFAFSQITLREEGRPLRCGVVMNIGLRAVGKDEVPQLFPSDIPY
jgi:hypothetical protein